VRVAAAEILAARGAPSAVPVLLPLVEAPELDTRIRAIRALEGAATPEAATRAVEFFENSEPPPREQLLQMADALFALTGAAGDTRLLPLLQVWLTGTDFEQRTIAARRLGAVQGARALPTLHELLFDGNPQVRTYAAQSLGKLGRGESVPALQRALDDRDPAVRREVAAALALIKDRAIVDVVSFLVSDMDEDVRLCAARALANVNHADALEGLRLALGDRDPRVRLAAFRGLIGVDGNSALREWPRVLGWLDPGEVPALARENAASFQSFLEAAVEHARPEIRVAAVQATQALGKTDRLALLARLVQESPQLDVRLSALATLLREQGGAARPMLHDLVNDAELAIRRAAMAALADVGDPSTVEVLRAYLVDKDEAIRIGSAAAIAAVLTR
jgi:HEAT repeat protein